MSDSDEQSTRQGNRSELGAYEVTVDVDLMVEMRDGVRLACDVYRPSRGGRPVEGPFPTVLVRTPYDKGNAEEEVDADLLTRHGFAVVIQDVRGRYASGGSYYHGTAETEDGYDTIEWIAARPWADGRVGMTGISYVAAVQCAAALSGAKQLVSLLHVKAPIDYYQDCNRHGGHLHLFLVPTIFYFAATSQEAQADPVLRASLLKAFENGEEWLRRMPLRQGLSPLAATPDIERWLLDMMEHETYDQFWTSVRMWQPGEYLDEYTDVPGLYVGGWYDMYREELLYEALARRKRGPVRLIMGPWTHFGFGSSCGDVDFGPDAELDYGALQLMWFRGTLKGGDAGDDADRPVRIFVMGGGDGTKTPEGRLAHGGRWRDERAWPPPHAEETAYYLEPNGGLSVESPAAEAPPSSFAYDPGDPVPTIGGVCYFMKPGETEPGQPRLFVPYGPQDQREREGVLGSTTNLPLAARADVLVFQTPPLERDVEVTGTPLIHLWFSSSAVDTDFAAKLVDVYPPSTDYPDGYALNLADGILRARYRLGFERPEFLTPEAVYELQFRLYATSNLFKSGHRIRIMVSSSDYPAYDPNPNNGATLMDPSKPPVVARNTVYHDAERPSHVVLPIAGGA